MKHLVWVSMSCLEVELTWVLVQGIPSPSLAPVQGREGGRRGGGRAPGLWGAGEGAGREAGRQLWAAQQTWTWNKDFGA